MDRAVENGVKPFTALAGLLSLALRSYLGKDEIQYSYSADTRREAGVPDALYNCVCSFQSGVKLNDDTRLADIVPKMDAEVLRTLQPEAKLRQMVQQMSWVYKVDQQKAPLRIKQRVFQMGEYISGEMCIRDSHQCIHGVLQALVRRLTHEQESSLLAHLGL